MKKLFITLAVLAVIAAALGAAGLAYAQSPAPTTAGPGSGYGPGGMGGRGARGGMGAGVTATGEGILHDAMIAVYAEKLGIPAADIEARLTNGETMAQIAISKGLTIDQFYTLMAEARLQAIDQAVKAGTLTQTQADWMKQRGGGQMGGMRGRGAGQGQGFNTGCPYTTTTTP